MKENRKIYYYLSIVVAEKTACHDANLILHKMSYFALLLWKRRKKFCKNLVLVSSLFLHWKEISPLWDFATIIYHITWLICSVFLKRSKGLCKKQKGHWMQAVANSWNHQANTSDVCLPSHSICNSSLQLLAQQVVVPANKSLACNELLFYHKQSQSDSCSANG